MTLLVIIGCVLLLSFLGVGLGVGFMLGVDARPLRERVRRGPRSHPYPHPRSPADEALWSAWAPAMERLDDDTTRRMIEADRASLGAAEPIGPRDASTSELLALLTPDFTRSVQFPESIHVTTADLSKLPAIKSGQSITFGPITFSDPIESRFLP